MRTGQSCVLFTQVSVGAVCWRLGKASHLLWEPWTMAAEKLWKRARDPGCTLGSMCSTSHPLEALEGPL